MGGIEKCKTTRSVVRIDNPISGRKFNIFSDARNEWVWPASGPNCVTNQIQKDTRVGYNDAIIHVIVLLSSNCDSNKKKTVTHSLPKKEKEERRSMPVMFGANDN